MTTPLSPRPDWHMSPKPLDSCPVCGGAVVAAATLDEEDGWRTFWACAVCQVDLWVTLGVESAIQWPFEDDQVCWELDLAALGFTVTEEWVHV